MVNFHSRNLLTFDIEDWYRLMGNYLGVRKEPDKISFERQVDLLLELLHSHNVKATFFCLVGSLSDRKHLVERICALGHEIASHGCNHEQISKTGLKAFKEDLHRSVVWLEEVTQRKVLGYRAPRFSILPDQLEEFLELCVSEGLVYDSSVFPISGWRYGIPRSIMGKPHIVKCKSGKLIEFPIATLKMLGKVWPVGGGGWWRVMPVGLINKSLREAAKEKGVYTTYFHPYEFSQKKLVATNFVINKGKALLWQLSQNLGRKKTYSKLDKMLNLYKFTSIASYIKEVDEKCGK